MMIFILYIILVYKAILIVPVTIIMNDDYYINWIQIKMGTSQNYDTNTNQLVNVIRYRANHHAP